MENRIIVEGISLYGYHGCLEEEGRVGGNYLVDVDMLTDFSQAAATDDLSKTIDYVVVYDLVRKEMGIRSKLIEHVAKRIADRLKAEINGLKSYEVKVSKLNPPMHGQVNKVCVIIREELGK